METATQSIKFLGRTSRYGKYEQFELENPSESDRKDLLQTCKNHVKQVEGSDFAEVKLNEQFERNN